MHELHYLLCIGHRTCSKVACNNIALKKERGNLWDHFTTIIYYSLTTKIGLQGNPNSQCWEWHVVTISTKYYIYGFSLARWYTWYQHTGFAESAQHRMKNHKLHIDFLIYMEIKVCILLLPSSSAVRHWWVFVLHTAWCPTYPYMCKTVPQWGI